MTTFLVEFVVVPFQELHRSTTSVPILKMKGCMHVQCSKQRQRNLQKWPKHHFGLPMHLSPRLENSYMSLHDLIKHQFLTPTPLIYPQLLQHQH